MEVFERIKGWYNLLRRRFAIGYRSPVNYERARPVKNLGAGNNAEAAQSLTRPLNEIA